MTRKTSRRLPTGELTRSVNKYLDAWHAVGDKVCSLWPEGQATLCAFDSGFFISVKGRREPVRIPTDLAFLIADLVEKKA